MIRKLKQKYKDLKYRYKTTLIIVLAGMLPVVLIVIYMQMGVLRSLREQETDSMQNSLNQAVDTLEGQIQIYENLIDYLSYSQNLRNVLSQIGESDYEKYVQYRNVVDPLLEMPQIYHKEIQGITIYSGNIDVEHGSSLVPMEAIQGEEWAEQLTDSSILEWFVQRGANKKIVVARKFYDEDDITAVLAMKLDYSVMLEPFTSLLKNNTGGIILDEDGNVIYSSYSMDEVFRPKSPESLEYLQKNYVCMEQEMENTGWYFYLYRPEKVITKSAYILGLRNIPIILLCIVLLVVLGYAFSKRLVSCLERLTENMNQVHRGFRKVTVDSDSKDEVGTLIRSFKRMMEELNKLISEVYEAKIELQHTEMRALQAQINPHFLYNSLSIINWKAIEAEEDEISKVTLDLSTYYRTSLNRGETMTTVENEIRNIRAYLNIQLIMHDNSFRVEEEIDESCYQIMTPKLILQPLVENAIDHGLDPLEKEEKVLTIRVKKEENQVVFQVQDNGNGMPQEKAEQILGIQSPGYGVHNVYERIKLLYKENGAMRIVSEEGRGTMVEIRIPEKQEMEYEGRI
ncbi:two-component system sensor histidine kinase YesM [Firmicutes bacterium i23-0019-B6]